MPLRVFVCAIACTNISRSCGRTAPRRIKLICDKMLSRANVYIYVCILYAYVFSYVEKLIFICIFYMFMFLHVFV